MQLPQLYDLQLDLLYEPVESNMALATCPSIYFQNWTVDSWQPILQGVVLSQPADLS